MSHVRLRATQLKIWHWRTNCVAGWNALLRKTVLDQQALFSDVVGEKHCLLFLYVAQLSLRFLPLDAEKYGLVPPFQGLAHYSVTGSPCTGLCGAHHSLLPPVDTAWKLERMSYGFCLSRPAILLEHTKYVLTKAYSYFVYWTKLLTCVQITLQPALKVHPESC